MTTFNETDVNRDALGKFDTQPGAGLDGELLDADPGPQRYEEPTTVDARDPRVHDAYIDQVDGQWVAAGFVDVGNPADLLGVSQGIYEERLEIEERRAVADWLESHFDGSAAHLMGSGHYRLEVDGPGQGEPFNADTAATSLTATADRVQGVITPGRYSEGLSAYLNTRVFASFENGTGDTPENQRDADAALDRLQREGGMGAPLSDAEASAVIAATCTGRVSTMLRTGTHADRVGLRAALLMGRAQHLGEGEQEERARFAHDALLAWVDSQPTFHERRIAVDFA